jgi:hypothetical protein
VNSGIEGGLAATRAEPASAPAAATLVSSMML